MSSNGSVATKTPDFPVAGTILADYGEREEVRELAARMMAFHPAFTDVGETGMIAAAQLAILSGANPLPTLGEIHVWIDNQGKLVAMLGIAFWRRKAREVDAPLWYVDPDNPDINTRSYEPRLMTEAEKEFYQIEAGAVAAICKGYRLSEYQTLLNAGMPWKVAQMQLCRTGIGTVSHFERFAQRDTRYYQKGDALRPPNARSWAWLAQKRAEQDVYRALSLINPNEFVSNPAPDERPHIIDHDTYTAKDANDDLF